MPGLQEREPVALDSETPPHGGWLSRHASPRVPASHAACSVWRQRFLSVLQSCVTTRLCLADLARRRECKTGGVDPRVRARRPWRPWHGGPGAAAPWARPGVSVPRGRRRLWGHGPARAGLFLGFVVRRNSWRGMVFESRRRHSPREHLPEPGPLLDPRAVSPAGVLNGAVCFLLFSRKSSPQRFTCRKVALLMRV